MACRPQKKDITLKIAFIKKQNDYICYKIEKKLFILCGLQKKNAGEEGNLIHIFHRQPALSRDIL